MKAIICLFSFVFLTAMTFTTKVASSESMPVTKALIPNIEFDVQFVGTVVGTPTLKVNGTPVASSITGNRWTAFVQESNSYGLYNFLNNKCYTLQGVGGTQCLCVTFNSNYKFNNCAQIEYNVATKTFTILNAGTNCTLKLGQIVCCITQADTNTKNKSQ
jgi:hypothetical protein